MEYKIICGKSEEKLNLLKDEVIDLVITSPPYNVNLGDNKFNKNPYDLYNDNRDHQEYIKWLKDIFALIKKKLKKGGRCVINIGSGKNGRVPTESDIMHFMTKELNFIPMGTIIWNKNDVSNRFSFGSFKSPSAPSFPKPFEYILLFAKDTNKLQYKGETDLTKQEFIDWSLSLWNVAPEKNMKKIGHPAAYPVALPYRLIKMLSWKYAIVLDPFSGSGTTGVACKKLDRNYIGIELSQKYCDISLKRIEETEKDIFSESDNSIKIENLFSK